jgi:hypothetical protein
MEKCRFSKLTKKETTKSGARERERDLQECHFLLVELLVAFVVAIDQRLPSLLLLHGDGACCAVPDSPRNNRNRNPWPWPRATGSSPFPKLEKRSGRWYDPIGRTVIFDESIRRSGFGIGLCCSFRFRFRFARRSSRYMNRGLELHLLIISSSVTDRSIQLFGLSSAVF